MSYPPTGIRFSRLVVIEREWNTPSDSARCLCDCGTVVTVRTRRLYSNNTKSCGCLRRDTSRRLLGDRQRTHGLSRTLTYKVWHRMIARCTDPDDLKYADYGGRGITVCERWMTFENFLADMGHKTRSQSINRIDNDGNYEPGNCEWTSAKVQANNTRRNRWITCNGETKTLSEWAKLIGIDPKSLSDRLLKQTPEQAITPGRRQ